MSGENWIFVEVWNGREWDEWGAFLTEGEAVDEARRISANMDSRVMAEGVRVEFCKGYEVAYAV